MAIATKSAATTMYDLRTATDAHQVMVDLDDHLTAVGLTQASFTGDYDPTGSSSQMPTVRDAVSPWMVYNFTDADQSSFPIAIWVRFALLAAVRLESGQECYVPQFRISEGVDSSGNPLGRMIENLAVGLPQQSGGDARFRVRTANRGNFVRYSGDTLTVLMGACGTDTEGYTVPHSLFEFHIERPRHHATNDVQAGFVGIAQPVSLGVSTDFVSSLPAANGYPAIISNQWGSQFVDIYSSPVRADIYNDYRAARGFALQDGTSSVIQPVYYRNADSRLNTFKRLFTVRRSAVTQCTPVLLDFSGTETRYLPYWTNHKALYNSTADGNPAHLFEWE